MAEVRQALQTKVPREIAKAMLEETKDNFDKQQYGNNGAAQKWADRYGYNRKLGLINAEPYLRYKKLNYKGKLKGSIKPISGSKYAGISASAPYAEAHNEGKASPVAGNSFRKSPYSSLPIKLGNKPQQRKFMGVGKRTYENVVKIYSKELRRLT